MCPVHPEFTYPVMGTVSQYVGVTVYRVPDGHGTCSNGEQIWLENRYAEKIRSLCKTRSIPVRGLFPIAQAVYFLLHEKGHVEQSARGEKYDGPRSEVDANKYAASHFRPWLRGVGLNEVATTKLWKSLPDYWRVPERI